MAEIKSTLELALEKTKHLVMSEDEKQQMKLEESLEKLPSAVQQFIDGMINLDKFLRIIEDFPDETKAQARKRTLKLLLDRLDLSSADKITKALGEIADPPYKESFSKIIRLYDEYVKESANLKDKIRKNVKEKLFSKNITGDGLEIIPERSQQFRDFKDKFEKMLTEMKKQAMEKLGN